MVAIQPDRLKSVRLAKANAAVRFFITIFPDEVRSVPMPPERIKWIFVTPIFVTPIPVEFSKVRPTKRRVLSKSLIVSRRRDL